jgi:hypothetical protein
MATLPPMKGETPEHLLLRQARLAFQQIPYSFSQFLVVGHGLNGTSHATDLGRRNWGDVA